MTTWKDAPPPPRMRIGAAGWLRVALRGPALALWIFGGLALLLACRLVERPLHGTHRPVTPRITHVVCRGALRIIGLPMVRHGTPMRRHGALVANHSSWLDIFVLNACTPVYFVSKSEVADWPGIGWLARATGTVFIRRDPREAASQRQVFEDRLEAGHRLLFFPEGTSTDGARVLPFKTTLFAAFFTHRMAADMSIQPVTVKYTAPTGADPAFYAWWGDMDFGPHLLRMLAARRHGAVRVTFGEPLLIIDHADRKTLARAAEKAVRDSFASG